MRIDYMINLACAPKQAVGPGALLPLLRQNDPRLAPLASHCRQCPASRNGDAFSCWGAIGAPIAAATEEWLTDMLDGDGDGIGIGMLQSVVEPFSGAPVHALRAQGAFERNDPYEVEWELEDDETLTLTLDQILHAMLFSGPQPPSALLVYAFAFELVPSDAPPDLLRAAIDDPNARRKLVQLAKNPAPPPSPQTMSFLLLFGAMLRAIWLD
jgi:hypothetical protein